jgi:hypothetical protein
MKKFHGDSCKVHADDFVRVIRKLYQFYSSRTPLAPKTCVLVDLYDFLC